MAGDAKPVVPLFLRDGPKEKNRQPDRREKKEPSPPEEAPPEHPGDTGLLDADCDRAREEDVA
jgi:hypothetical protein